MSPVDCTTCKGSGDHWDGGPCVECNGSGKREGTMSTTAIAHARAGDPATAKAAAAAVSGKRATDLEGKVWTILRENGPLTSWQIAKRGDIEYGSTSPRLRSLEEKGLVRRLPEERREGRKPSIVWEACDPPKPGELPPPKPKKKRRTKAAMREEELGKLRDLVKVIAQRLDEKKLTGEAAQGLRDWIRTNGYA